jgi:hypothetical protein
MSLAATRRTLLGALLGLCLVIAGPVTARRSHDANATTGLADATVLIVRHAEKPDVGNGLTPAGEHRAMAYADYFRRFEIDGAPVHIDTLVATLDTPKSARPRLTVEPFAKASGLQLQQPFADKQVHELAVWLAAQPPGRTTLIAWHHGQIPNLLTALGADPVALIGAPPWPASVYNWVVVLHYDSSGRLITSRLVHEPDGLER